MTWSEIQARTKSIRGQLAELVIARGWPVKAAAYELGINRKTCEWHVWKLKRLIRAGTETWWQAKKP
jgi:predicted transcriptional regulator